MELLLKKTVLHASLFALTMPMSLFAIGLGNMTVKSTLNQPFSAEIKLIDVGSTPLPRIKVGLADPENFEQIGLERRAVLSLLSFTLVRTPQGKFVILVQSVERMTEPYMEVAVDLTWPKGQLYKAYTVLLDPPGYQLVSTKAQSSPTHYSKHIKKHTYEPGVINKTVTTTVARNPVELNDSKKKATYGPTVANENVWQIAQRYKTSEVILPQVVLAIVGANPDAFHNDNLNGLKVGVKLNIPSTEEVLLIPADLATEEVMAHDKAWNDKTAIIHVLSPPYINGQPANTPHANASPMVKKFQIPAISKLIVQQGTPQKAVKNVTAIETALPIIHSEQFHTLQNNVQPQVTEHYSTTRAELSITSAAVESVRESNALLMEQLQLLQEQNKKLQQQLDKSEKELERIHTKMDLLMKERLAIAAQASSINSSGSSVVPWPLFALLFLVVGGGVAYWYFKLRQPQKNRASPYFSKLNVDESSSHDVLEFETGLHRLISEKANVEQNNIQSDEEKGLDFVSSLNESVKYEENGVAISEDESELLEFENTQDTQDMSIEFESHVSPPATEEVIGIEKTVSDEHPLNLESSTPGEPSGSLKSTKALNTLLDLAKTYMSMDDFESARNSLSEVLAHGDDSQREKAQRLLAQMNG